jgi:hypothetical protein
MKSTGCKGCLVEIAEKYPNDNLRVQEWIEINSKKSTTSRMFCTHYHLLPLLLLISHSEIAMLAICATFFNIHYFGILLTGCTDDSHFIISEI